MFKKNWYEVVDDFWVTLSNGICNWSFEINPYMISEWLQEPDVIFYADCPDCGKICVFSLSIDEAKRCFNIITEEKIFKIQNRMKSIVHAD
jgi:hypothetical protein